MCLERLLNREMFGVEIDALLLISSLANMAAGYNLAIAGHVLYLIELSGVQVSETVTSEVASAAFAGAVTGQICMGFVGEKIGVVRGLIVTFVVLAIGCILGAGFIHGNSILMQLAVTRFIVGFGAGGVYPLAAIASSESQQTHQFSGRRVMFAFSFQGVGTLLAPLWVLILDELLPNSRNIAWRIAIFSGAIPAGYAIGLSTTINQGSGGIQDDVVEHDEMEEEDVGFGRRWTCLNLWKLVGTGGSWFLFDVMFYGNIVFTPFVLELVFGITEPAEIAGLSVVVGCIALPGLWLASYVSDSWGRKRLQNFGFAALGVLFLVLFVILRMEHYSPLPVFILYCMTFFFYNFGPNATTFCLPAETFPKPVRSFFNGLSAAMGKLGAAVGASFFKVVLDNTDLAFVMLSSAILSVVAILVTQVFVKGIDEVERQHVSLGSTENNMTSLNHHYSNNRGSSEMEMTMRSSSSSSSSDTSQQAVELENI